MNDDELVKLIELQRDLMITVATSDLIEPASIFSQLETLLPAA